MAKKNRLKRAANTALAPTDAAQAATFLARIGTLVRQREAIQAELDTFVTKAKQDAEAKATPLATEIDTLTRGLQLWAEANREALTKGGRTKTIQLASGELAWRIRPASVRITGVDDVIARLQEMGLVQFLRSKVEIDKAAMLAAPAQARAVPGVSIGSEGEEFIVEPITVPLAEGAVA